MTQFGLGNIKLSTQCNEKFSQFLEKMSKEYFEECSLDFKTLIGYVYL